jgi:hypothetical protein
MGSITIRRMSRDGQPLETGSVRTTTTAEIDRRIREHDAAAKLSLADAQWHLWVASTLAECRRLAQSSPRKRRG